MNRTGDLPASTRTAREIVFRERIRKALSHDLRTPLGTIANYASILEYHGDPKPVEVPVFAGRIRSSAIRAASMLQTVSDALVLSQRPLISEMFEPRGVLRAVLSELALHAHFPARGSEPSESLPIDRDLLAFVWKSFLIANSEASKGRVLDIDLEVISTDEDYATNLWLGPVTLTATEMANAERFQGVVADHGPLDACFALGFAEDLVHLHGGSFGLFGRAGEAAGLRITFPRGR